jgi:hypothetical protein
MAMVVVLSRRSVPERVPSISGRRLNLVLITATVAIVLSVAALVVSIKSARSARRSADEAFRTRSDALGPAVAIVEERALRERWNFSTQGLPGLPAMYPPGVAPVDRRFIKPANLGVQILVGAYFAIVNEGTRTAKIEIDAFRVDRCDDVSDIGFTLEVPAESPSRLIPDGRISLKPNERVGVVVRQGPTIGEWLQHGDQPHIVNVRAQCSPDGARQNWKVVLTAQIIDTVWGNDSEFRVVPHTPPGIAATELPRTYPDGALIE